MSWNKCRISISITFCYLLSRSSTAAALQPQIIDVDKELADDVGFGEPSKKKKKPSEDEAALKTMKEEQFADQCIGAMNKFLVKTNSSARAQRQNIKVQYNIETASLKASSQCVLCKEWLVCNIKKDSTSAFNFKRHMTSQHLNEKLEVKNKDQKKIDVMFKGDTDGDTFDLTAETGALSEDNNCM